jgi:hypothetical protein
MRPLRDYKINPTGYCIDCGNGDAPVHYGGGPRCTRCSQTFDLMRRQRAALIRARAKEALDVHIAEGCPDDGLACSNCCDHYEHDHGICYDCGEDITQTLVSQADFLD